LAATGILRDRQTHADTNDSDRVRLESQTNRSGADVLAFEAAGFAIGRTPAVVGLLQASMGFGHDDCILLVRSHGMGLETKNSAANLPSP